MDTIESGIKEIRKRILSPRGGKKKNIYLTYHPVRASVTVPAAPCFRYQTSIFGYYGFKYLLPISLGCIYLIFSFSNIRTGPDDLLPPLKIFFSVFFSPVQSICLILMGFVVYATAPLAHIIFCEEGMFVRTAVNRVFVPWKHLRSYRESRYAQPWIIIISFYTSKSLYRRIYTFTSLETEHTKNEILKFIHTVRHSEEQKPEADNP